MVDLGQLLEGSEGDRVSEQLWFKPWCDYCVHICTREPQNRLVLHKEQNQPEFDSNKLFTYLLRSQWVHFVISMRVHVTACFFLTVQTCSSLHYSARTMHIGCTNFMTCRPSEMSVLQFWWINLKYFTCLLLWMQINNKADDCFFLLCISL